MVFAVDFSISLAADEEGVTVSALPPEAAAAVAVVPPSQDVAVAAVAQALRPQPQPSPAPVPAKDRRASVPSTAPAPPQPVGLRQHLTGLPGVVWQRQGIVDEPQVIGVTPGSRFEPDRMTF